MIIAATAASAIAFAAAGPTVAVKDDFFSPKSKTVSKGQTVTWKWRGQAPHNVVVNKGPKKFRSSVKSSGRYRKKMTRRGRYSLLCTIHAPSMKMTLRVK